MFVHRNSLAAAKSKEDFHIRKNDIDHEAFDPSYFEGIMDTMWESLVKPRIDYPHIPYTLTTNAAESTNHRYIQ